MSPARTRTRPRDGGSRGRSVREFISGLVAKGADDNLFFLASGLTFNLVLAALPFLALLVAAAGFFLGPRIAEPGSIVLERLWQLVPAAGSSMPGDLQDQVAAALEGAGSLGLVSGVLFAWFSTRLLGTLRTVLSEVFDLRDRRGIVEGKFMDFGLVLLATVLLTINVGLSTAVSEAGVAILDLFGLRLDVLTGLVGWLAAFLFAFLMFFLIYKFIPARNPSWRTAVSAAVVASVGYELLKVGFGLYLSYVAGNASVFSAFLTPIVFVVSLYYGAVLFILAGEIAQLVQERRRMRQQREVLD